MSNLSSRNAFGGLRQLRREHENSSVVSRTHGFVELGLLVIHPIRQLGGHQGRHYSTHSLPHTRPLGDDTPLKLGDLGSQARQLAFGVVWRHVDFHLSG